ncbi:MAG: hypothetical protein VX633_12285, partial [Verrucomicrobiota bacterium]|nr:hypothetical protein [Verrucomicrobiota bacterium]
RIAHSGVANVAEPLAEAGQLVPVHKHEWAGEEENQRRLRDPRLRTARLAGGLQATFLRAEA